MKVTVKQIARFKDINQMILEVDMPMPKTDKSDEVADYYLYQFSDNIDVMCEMYCMIKDVDSVHYEDLEMDEMSVLFRDFFGSLPENTIKLNNIFLLEKHMQYLSVLNQVTSGMNEAIAEKVKTSIGQFTESLNQKVSEQTD